jgi:hypothetical protein
MRIAVLGDCLSAKAVRGLLEQAGYVVVSKGQQYTLKIAESAEPSVIVDGVDCELERHVVNEIAKLIDGDIVLRRAGGVQSDVELSIIVPANDDVRIAVERGIVRGFMRTARRPIPEDQKPFWKRTIGLFGLMFAIAIASSAYGQVQQPGAIGAGGGGGPASTVSIDQTGSHNDIDVLTLPAITFAAPQHAIVDSGAITFSNTSIQIGGSLPTGSNTIGAVNLAQYTPVSGRLPVDGSGVTQPVSHANFANLDAALSTLLSSSTFTGRINTLGQKAMAASTPVVIASDQSALPVSQSGTWNIGSVTTLPAITFASPQAVTQSGTWTVQPGNTANTTAWKVDGSAMTQPVSFTQQALPANQSVNVNQYGGTNTTLGQKAAASSMPVVLPSDALPPPDRATTGTVTAPSQVVSILSQTAYRDPQ